MTKLRILIADDHEVVRRGLRALLEGEPGWVVCAETSTGKQAVERARAERPDIVILDIAMPDMNGLDAARQIRVLVPQARVLILSVHHTDEVVREVVASGAAGYVLKSDAGRDLVEAVASLAAGRIFFTQRATSFVLEEYRRRAASETPSGVLSSREREVLQLLADGLSNKDIAKALKISPKTVEAHRGNIMRKLSLHSVGELVRYAVRNRLVEP